MEQSKEDLAKFKKLSKKSQYFFFGTFFSLATGSIVVLFSFIRLMIMGKMSEHDTNLHYWVFGSLLVVCIILYLVFYNKYKKASDSLAKFFKEKVLSK